MGKEKITKKMKTRILKTKKNDVLKRIILLDKDCMNPEYASDHQAILLIVRDIAKVARQCKKEEEELCLI